MAKTYADIQKEIAALQKTADSLRQKEVASVIDRIKVAIETYQLTAADLGLRGGGAIANPFKAADGRKRATKVARKSTAPKPRYRDEAGNSWTGRGRRPQWFLQALESGKTLEDLSV